MTGLATFVLVLVVTLVWSVLAFLDMQTEAKSQNLKALVTEKYQNPSQMPFAYADKFPKGRRGKKGDYRSRSRQGFDVLGLLHRHARSGQRWPVRDLLFFFAMEPRKVMSVDAHGNIDLDDGRRRRLHRRRASAQLAADCLEMEKYPDKVLLGPKTAGGDQ